MQNHVKNMFLKKEIFVRIVPKYLIFVCILAIVLSGCNSKIALSPTTSDLQTTSVELNNISQSSLEQIQTKGILIVGTAITEPFVFHDPHTDALIGLDIDIANYIAEQLGVDIKFIEMPFANLIPALQDAKIDMVIAAMYITPEREILVDFSEPYLDTGLVIVGQADLPEKIKIVQDLEGLKVGVKISATGARLAEELIIQGIDITIIEYKNTLDSFLDLEVGRVDVIFNDYLNTLVYLKNSQAPLEIVTNDMDEIEFLSKVGLGIAVSQDNHELLEFINTSLAKMKQDNFFEQTYNTWLFSSGR